MKQCPDWCTSTKGGLIKAGDRPQKGTEMKRTMTRHMIWAAMLAAGIALATPAGAEMGQGRMGGQKEMGSPQMSGVMHDMAKEMKEMSEPMSKGTMSPDMQKQMAERMKQMSGMMEKMSGMAGKGMMMDADMHKQMDQMRKRMDEMMKESPMTPKKK